MAGPSHIVVVDDDARIRNLLQRYLTQEGFRVTVVDGGGALREVMSRDTVDLVLLDLVMPGEDGLSLAREIRAASTTPIIMLTGKGDLVDRVVGLEMGADDYIAKPFHLREVLARIRSVLRRTAGSSEPSPAAENAQTRVYEFAGWRLDVDKRELLNARSEPVSLTTGEFDLLLAFLTHSNRPLNRDQLMDIMKGRDWSPFDRSVDTQVGRLRKKIERDPGEPELIKTVRGVGYLFAARVTRKP